MRKILPRSSITPTQKSTYISTFSTIGITFKYRTKRLLRSSGSLAILCKQTGRLVLCWCCIQCTYYAPTQTLTHDMDKRLLLFPTIWLEQCICYMCGTCMHTSRWLIHGTPITESRMRNFLCQASDALRCEFSAFKVLNWRGRFSCLRKCQVFSLNYFNCSHLHLH
jgi:hypothetical protein